MTDKEIRRMKDGVISIFEKFNILDHAATIGSLRDDILRLIDSMQEECNITSIKSKEVTGKLKECIDNITDESLAKARKQLQEESQVCMYSTANYTDEDRKALCEDCEEKCKFNKKEEPASERFAFKAIPRLLEMIKPTDRAKAYVAKLVDALEKEGYVTDAKIVRESLMIMKGAKVGLWLQWMKSL